MKCPKCDSDFEAVSFNEVVVDRCKHCRGLWFDMLEKDDLLKMEGSEMIDVGAAMQGKRYNKLEDIQCPRCDQKMISMVDTVQSHIHYESCPGCFGTFFDAGEFRDLKEHTVVERFVELMKTLKANL